MKDKFFQLTILLLYLTFAYCVIEIPIKVAKVDGVPKHGDINHVNHFKNLRGNKLMNEEGNAFIASSALYIATVRIGSDSQEFQLIMDTGSDIVWVPKVGSNDKASLNHHYNPSSSSSAVDTKIAFNLIYGTGSCSGTYYFDNVNYINNKLFKAAFGVATQTNLPNTGADGIIGLGHLYYDQQLSFVNMLIQGGVTNSRLFSFKFGNNINIGSSGKFVVGKHEDFSKQNVVTSPLDRSSRHWATQITSFGLRNPRGLIESRRSYNVIFDTGTNAIYLPLEYAQDFANQINGLNCFFTAIQDQTMFSIVCQYENDLPDFRFQINGRYLVIPKRFMFSQQFGYYYSACYFGQSQIYIIGSPFFFAFHTLFDKDNELLHFYPENSEYLEN